MVHITYCSEKGNVRTQNEDYLLIADEITQACSHKNIRNTHFLVAVADGMGGYQEGARAAKTVLEYIQKRKPSNRQMVVATLLEAKEALKKIAAQERISLGTALAGISWHGNKALIFNVGDCRIYKISPQEEKLLSKDHTLAHELQEAGIKNFNSNILTSSISGGMGIEDFEIFFSSTTIEKGNKIVLCSDGFWKEFASQMKQIAFASNILKAFEKAKKGKELCDNVSFVVIEQKGTIIDRLLYFIKENR
ncbi:PP2C family protein-serine/threonine phosphatase [Nitratiruptor sp. SB155-2]|uniref:PP2C family protein-serine/threonine phosphatase n=1 Tax=Nitratiruptor sp. (strain SB155-2) TaxID=387092 RepID=UPI0001586D0D|nr:PP2C family serine/threonine-protein phosphatase [Nitratiruptor sp. SB155-2]BAF69306.1 protein phosphatase [Nitratiruptor sp. SB155-2]